MRIICLGTSAADFPPSLEKEDCYKLDKDIRRSTVTLLDEQTLIDCGPHLMDELKIHKVNAERICDILVTHEHSDHFYPESLQALQKSVGKTLHVWHNQQTDMLPLEGIEYHPMQIGETYSVGTLRVTPLAANHQKGAVHYSIECGDKKLFYGCDGAWLLHDTFYYMKDQNYDVMILDATVGDYVGDYRLAEHNSIPMIRLMMPSLRTWGVADEHTKIVLDHLARSLHENYEKTCELVKDDGFIVAYDGMCLEV